MGKLDEMRRMTAGQRGRLDGGRPARRARCTAGRRALDARADGRGSAKSKNAAEIPVDRIGPDPDQPREEFDDGGPRAAGRVAARRRGQLQPIRVRWDEERGQYVIICGRAALEGRRPWPGLATMSCVVVDGPIPPGELLAMQLVENLLREDLKPIEQARAYRALMDGNGWSVPQVARELAVDHSNVSRALALLDLPERRPGAGGAGGLAAGDRLRGQQARRPRRPGRGRRPGRRRGAHPGRDRRGGQAGREQAEGRGIEGQGGKARKLTERVIRTRRRPG